MKSYTVQQYITAGCHEMEHSNMLAVHGITGGKVCDTGCHAFNGGKCQAYKKLTAVTSQVKKTKYEKTNREFAKNDTAFRKACGGGEFDTVRVTEPTPRQASKYRNGKGAAYKAMMKANNKAVQP